MNKTKIETISLALGLVIHESKVLLIERYEPEQPLLHENYELPGGKIESGEKPEHAAVREILEETGVITQVMHPLPITFQRTRKYGADKKKIKICCYRCRYVDLYTSTVKPRKVKDVKWIDLFDLNPLEVQSGSLLFLREILQTEKYPVDQMKMFADVWSVELRSMAPKENRYRWYQILVRAGQFMNEHVFHVDTIWGRVRGNYYNRKQSKTLRFSNRDKTLKFITKNLTKRCNHNYYLVNKSSNFPPLEILSDFKLYVNPQLTIF